MKSPIKEKGTRTATFFGGVLVLTLANIFVKLFGFLYKVPLNRLLGDEMANVNAAYSVYSLLYMISTAGIPVAVSVMISEARSAAKNATVGRIFRISVGSLSVIGAIGTLVMLIFAAPIARANSGGDSYLCLLAIAPALFFVCLSSVFRGYFQGFGLMLPTAVSGMIEAFGKMALGLILVRLVLSSHAENTHLAAGYSVLGITVGIALGTLYLALVYARRKHSGALTVVGNEVVSESVSHVTARLLRIAVPIALSAGISGIASLIDAQLMRPLLADYYGDAELAKAVFSDYSTGAVTLFNMPAVLVYPIASAIVPYITAARARGDAVGAGQYVAVGIRLSALISLPAALGMSVLASPILSFLFVGDTDMAEHAGAPLSLLALSVFFLGLLAITNAVLQAYGQQGRPLIAMLCGVLVKIFALYLLTPRLGALAAPLGTLLFYLTAVCINFYYVFRYAMPTVDWYKAFLLPTVSAFLAAVCAYGAYRLFGTDGAIPLIAAIGGAAIVYFAAVLLLGIVSAEDLALLPRGKRLSAFLIRHHVIRTNKI